MKWQQEIIIKDTHRGIYYKDGVFVKILNAGRYVIPPHINWGIWRTPKIEITLVDIRERDLTIKGQEILTADKVAIRVSIIVQFRVVDARAAIHEVENYENRLYSDVQLAARRSLASMSLEQILTNRNQLSEDILQDVQEVASRYGISILRADVKDLIFPGNLQEIMNKVLATERLSQAQLVEARTKAEVKKIEAQAQQEIRQLQTEAEIISKQKTATQEAEIQQIKTQAIIDSLKQLESVAIAYSNHPALLRLQELEMLKELANNSNAQIYFNSDNFPTKK
ncbi:SPFH domain-containing protein [Geminocystis sp. NIES-3709]|uniref:SPFH domain-containing protein n=1 Tax=Geminocystis sp. NIES-3709 TaxID=1617448 RepID=UPI0005FC6AE5|nr:SPFH domain-containing protein [Geminocystis sp. NIES-3709]BAQ66316.1 putative stomatin/prohibitin-family membrane protease subunit aq_911 [Geminocystis sp. NIES-3709]